MKELKNLKTSNNKKLLTALVLTRLDDILLNDCAYSLLDGLKDTYIGDPLSQSLTLYFNPKIWGRVLRAIRQTGQDVPGAPGRVLYNIDLVPTFSQYLTNPNGSSVNTSALLVLGGYKSQRATAMEPTSWFQQSARSRSYMQAVWTDYGAAAEVAQNRKLNFA